MPQGWSRNDRHLPSPPLVSVTGAPPLPTKDRRQPSCDTHHPPSILMILAASLWNVNRNPTKEWRGDDVYPAEYAFPGHRLYGGLTQDVDLPPPPPMGSVACLVPARETVEIIPWPGPMSM
jgi:hypothetical protein